MEILSLDIEGFRSLKSVSWRPGRLNVLIGPNGSGKSNLLRMLELISVSAKGQLGKHIQRAGGMEPLVWDGAAASIHFAVRTSSVVESHDAAEHNFTYDLIALRKGRGSTYYIDCELLRHVHASLDEGVSNSTRVIDRDTSGSALFDEENNSLVDLEEPLPEEESLLSLASGPLAKNGSVPLFQEFLAGWAVYHDVHVYLDAPIRQPVVSRLETRVEPDGQNLINVLHTLYSTEREFKEDINLAMRAAFGDEFEELVFPPAADQRVQLRIRWKSLRREQSAADLSDGTLRFLFLLTVLASPNPAPLIAIDEPETGLHPSMFPIIAEYADEASERTQVVFSTHSPQFLDAFGDVRPTTTVVNCTDGKTSLTNLEGESFERWLKEFSLGSLFQSGELEGTLADMAVRDSRSAEQGGDD